MDDTTFKRKYQKYKNCVKLWERDFKSKYSRIPSKYDIREAPQEIRNAYKMYYNLKTSFLEDTLNDVLDDDGFNVLEISQAEGEFSAEAATTNESRNLSSSIATLVEGARIPDISKKVEPASGAQEIVTNANLAGKVINKFDALVYCSSNENAWGPELSNKSKKNAKQSECDAPRKSFTSTVSAKLFKAASFTKRNPRKSISRTNSEMASRPTRQKSAPNSLGSSEILPDLEMILAQKAKEIQSLPAITVNPMLGKDAPSQMQVDAGWLSRNTADNGFKIDLPTAMQHSQSVEDVVGAFPAVEKHSYGLSNLNVKTLVPLPGDNCTLNSGNKTKHIVREDRTMTDSDKMIRECKKGGELEEVQADASLKTRKEEVFDSDSVVSDSAGEEEKRTYRHIAKRRRVLKTIEKNQLLATISDPLKKIEKLNQPKEMPDINHSVDLHHKNADNFDFSTDSNENGLYATSKNKKSARNKSSTSGTQREKAKSTKAKEPKRREARNLPRSAKNCKAVDTRKTRDKRKLTATITKDHSDSEAKNVDAVSEEVIEKPPEATMLQYSMLLDRSEVTCTPRVPMCELERADDVAQRYINNTHVAGISTTTSAPAAQRKSTHTPLINEKREAARKKLEEKMAAGKLNENFVTINLQKKIFARGKRNIIYSKYKKQQWRHKKRIAALAGPNMDMGGCDGGVLTCFSCGQLGHFASQCKVKGDSLLPLTAQVAEDPSPFPTLEEAERMAADSAIVVHSRNISKLPEAANSSIFRDTKHDVMNEKKIDTSVLNITAEQKRILSDVTIDSEEEKIYFESDEELESIDVTATAVKNLSPIKKYVGHKIPEDFLKKTGIHPTDIAGQATNTHFGSINPLYKLNSNGSVRSEVPSEVMDALRLFGHTNFRKGQELAIMRVLSGLSTLVTLSTGSGKSLCYQLPAYLYSSQRRAITLVVSPLVSLMEDQVTGVPHFLRAHCLHTNQTPQQRLKVMKMINDGEIDILLVSPEAVVAGERSTGFGVILRQLPPIAFACIDEAHCVSQWSHNFRPSYLMICKVLKQNLGINTILGLTATATSPTRLSIIDHLGIVDGVHGIISDTPLPDNLLLSVSKDENKDAALLALLTSDRFSHCQSIIVYCTRRDECERVSSYLRTCMQDRHNDKGKTETGKRKRKRTTWAAEPYHAGMPASRRRTIQNAFMRNELRIVVATIAFGMGINKPDLRAVIHYNMPRNYESYVQEIGRAGRDGKPAHCHLFLDARGGDQCELRRHIFANSLDRHVIRKLLQRVFVPCACAQKDQTKEQPQIADNIQNSVAATSGDGGVERGIRERICSGHEIGFSIKHTIEALDLPEENISTLLCYLELDPRWNISVLSNAYTVAKVISYGGAKYLKHAAKECPPLAMAIALEIKQNKLKEDANIIEFSVIDIAAAIGWNSGVVKYQLKKLEWTEVDGYPRRSSINVNFYDLGFRVKAPGDFTSEEIDEALDTLYNRAVQQEQTQLMQLQYVFQGLSSVAYDTYIPSTSANFSPDRSNQLKGIIRAYFQNDYPKDLKLESDDSQSSNVSDKDIEHDVLSLINLYPDNNFSGRSIARIFHGISSPNYQAVIWGRCKYWRAHTKVDFNRILKLSNALIVRRRL